MAWKDKLQPASFRGVPFHVESDDLSAGRRVQVHEYPQRDKPYAEDNGRASREISVVAFVVGADYMAARDRLLGAVEEAGPGTLVHPWYGSLQVVVTACRVTHSNADGGMARFAITCVEAGELTFPRASSATDAKVRLAADTAATASVDDFAKSFSVAGVQDFVKESALQKMTLALGAVTAGLKAVSGDIDGAVGAVLNNLDGMMTEPRGLAGEVFAIYDGLVDLSAAPVRLARDGGTSRNYRLARALLELFGNKSLSAPSSIVRNTPARAAEARNTAAIMALVRRASLTTSARAVAASPLPVHDDAVALRNALAAAIDAESHAATDEAYTALTDLRVMVHQDVSARTRDSARLDTVVPREVQPALVLAYDLYEDAARADEIVERNRIRHPGFMPAEPLRVLSR